MTDDVSVRPPLDKGRLARALGFRVEVADEVASTNAVVAERARNGSSEGFVLAAEHQTDGRGRLDRAWETPPHAALTFSVLWRPTAPADTWPWLPLLTGLAVAHALREAGFRANVKWPNDVLIGDRKVAGILVERIETPRGPAAVVGIGINVSTTAEELPVPTATSLEIESGAAPDRTELLLALLRALREEYDGWQRHPLPELRSSYVARCVTVGRLVRVELPTGDTLTGTATGIDPDGRLLVRGPGGETAVGAGDVVHVRAVRGH